MQVLNKRYVLTRVQPDNLVSQKKLYYNVDLQLDFVGRFLQDNSTTKIYAPMNARRKTESYSLEIY